MPRPRPKTALCTKCRRRYPDDGEALRDVEIRPGVWGHYCIYCRNLSLNFPPPKPGGPKWFERTRTG
jgi:hypothetical protein